MPNEILTEKFTRDSNAMAPTLWHDFVSGGGNAENGNGVPAKIQREFECEFDFATKTLANSSIFEQPDKEYFAANHINLNFMNCKSICLDK